MLRGIARSSPALYQAYELGEKAARVGFDWPSTDGALEKVAEEAREVMDAPGDEERSAEIGDLLFALTTLARHLQIEPEDALRAANARFRQRFMALEDRAQREGRSLAELSREDWLEWWNAAKSEVGQSS